MAKCFLDIDIGDPEAHAAAQLSYEATVRFFEENTGQLGQPADAAINSIEADTRELVADAFRSRSASVGQVFCRIDALMLRRKSVISMQPHHLIHILQDEPRQEPPPPFCVGRIIIELCKEVRSGSVHGNFHARCLDRRTSHQPCLISNMLYRRRQRPPRISGACALASEA